MTTVPWSGPAKETLRAASEMSAGSNLASIYKDPTKANAE